MASSVQRAACASCHQAFTAERKPIEEPSYAKLICQVCLPRLTECPNCHKPLATSSLERKFSLLSLAKLPVKNSTPEYPQLLADCLQAALQTRNQELASLCLDTVAETLPQNPDLVKEMLRFQALDGIAEWIVELYINQGCPLAFHSSSRLVLRISF